MCICIRHVRYNVLYYFLRYGFMDLHNQQTSWKTKYKIYAFKLDHIETMSQKWFATIYNWNQTPFTTLHNAINLSWVKTPKQNPKITFFICLSMNCWRIEFLSVKCCYRTRIECKQFRILVVLQTNLLFLLLIFEQFIRLALLDNFHFTLLMRHPPTPMLDLFGFRSRKGKNFQFKIII